MSRQFVNYAFYKVAPEWRRLPCATRDEQRKQLLARLEDVEPPTVVRSYSTVGLRGDVDFLLWSVSDRLEGLRELASAIASTDMGGYLTTPHHFLAMTRRSTYVASHHHKGQEG